MNHTSLTLTLLCCLAPFLSTASAVDVAVPAPAAARLATPRVEVVPDRVGWTYEPGENVTFRVSVTYDRQPLGDVEAKVIVGPEMITHEEQSVTIPAEGLEIDGGTMPSPGFIRCRVAATIEGKEYVSVATAGFAPEQIQPTQAEPEDFDAFWEAGKESLANVPMDAKVTLMPDACTADVNVYHVALKNVGFGGAKTTSLYGILCEPKAPGKYPAVLHVPGAGVRPYSGQKDLAAKGVITFQIGIHGIPVTLPTEVYNDLRAGALDGYNAFNLAHRDRYYYRRVYLGCVRANDFLTSRENWDGTNLGVTGGSQGGQLTIVTAALDPRVTALAAIYPAYCDVTGYLHGRAGGWPHMFRDEADGHRNEAAITTTAYYDVVNFARRLKAPGFFTWGYNDVTCPPTSMFAAYNVITSPKELSLALETGHNTTPEQRTRLQEWLLEKLTSDAPATSPAPVVSPSRNGQ